MRKSYTDFKSAVQKQETTKNKENLKVSLAYYGIPETTRVNKEVQGKAMENPWSNIAPILLCYCCFQTTTNNTFKHKPIVTDFCTSYFAVHSKRYCKWSYKYYNLLNMVQFYVR